MKLDAAIIGAGPSGAWAAYLLAQQGARVRLFDPSHPREKPCGGGVTGRALAVVSRALSAADFPTVRIRTARFVDTAARGEDTAPTSESGHGSAILLAADALVVASRAAFDGALLAAACRAGAELVAARVRQLGGHAGAFQIETADGGQHTASHLVGADGANSFVRRTLASAFRRDQLSIATGFFAHGITSNEIVIELMCDPPGYLWSFPRPDHLAIGICAQADAGVDAAALRSRVRDWIGRVGFTGYSRVEPYSWPIPSLSGADFETLDVSREGWYLLGDAAGLVDPITREGIYFALQSAQYAADALLGGSTRASHDYADRVRTEIVEDLVRAARIKAAFFRPRFSRLLVSALAESEPIREVMADLVAGTQSYRTLRWRLAKTMEVGVAWRFVRSLWSGLDR